MLIMGLRRDDVLEEDGKDSYQAYLRLSYQLVGHVKWAAIVGCM